MKITVEGRNGEKVVKMDMEYSSGGIAPVWYFSIGKVKIEVDAKKYMEAQNFLLAQSKPE